MHRTSTFLGSAAVAALLLAAPSASAETRTAVFAGGCFWSVENNFDHVPGVVSTTSGFSGGTVADPGYMQVVRGGTGHLEAVEVSYDPAKVSYEELLQAFWHSIDPTDPSGQFCDQGDSYRTAVFVSGEAEEAAAQASRTKIADELGMKVSTEIRPAAPFYAAEAEHQDFAQKNPGRYERYRIGCGRDAALKRVWGEQAYLGLRKDKLG